MTARFRPPPPCRACRTRRRRPCRRCAISSAVYGDKIWGRFGFVDAFCEAKDWYADTYLAIDQGPIIVMIENHRTGLLWNLFMKAPEIQAGLRVSPLSPIQPDPTADGAARSAGLSVNTGIARVALMRSVSPVNIVKNRPGFAQTDRPHKGSIVASPVLGVV